MMDRNGAKSRGALKESSDRRCRCCKCPACNGKEGPFLYSCTNMRRSLERVGNILTPSVQLADPALDWPSIQEIGFQINVPVENDKPLQTDGGDNALPFVLTASQAYFLRNLEFGFATASLEAPLLLTEAALNLYRTHPQLAAYFLLDVETNRDRMLLQVYPRRALHELHYLIQTESAVDDSATALLLLISTLQLIHVAWDAGLKWRLEVLNEWRHVDLLALVKDIEPLEQLVQSQALSHSFFDAARALYGIGSEEGALQSKQLLKELHSRALSAAAAAAAAACKPAPQSSAVVVASIVSNLSPNGNCEPHPVERPQAEATTFDERRSASINSASNSGKSGTSDCSLDKDGEVKMEEAKQRNNHGEQAMAEPIEGRARKFVETVMRVVNDFYERLPDDIPSSVFETVSQNDLFEFTYKMLLQQEKFRFEGKPCAVDLGFHYTRESNINTIVRNGLLTKVERESLDIDAKFNGSKYGDGVYTSSDPYYGSAGYYGNRCIVVARLMGAPDVDAKTIKSVILLRESAQCVPIAMFPRLPDGEPTNRPPTASRGYSGALLHAHVLALFDMLTVQAVNPLLNQQQLQGPPSHVRTEKWATMLPSVATRRFLSKEAKRLQKLPKSVKLAAPTSPQQVGDKVRDGVARVASLGGPRDTYRRPILPASVDPHQRKPASTEAPCGKSDTSHITAGSNIDGDAGNTAKGTKACREAERAMLGTIDGRAWRFVETVSKLVSDFCGKGVPVSLVGAMSKDDLFHCTHKMLELQGKFKQFRKQEKASIVDLAFHHTHTDSLPVIGRSGLFTKGKWGEIGNGVYTSDNPYYDEKGRAFDCCVIAARLKGKQDIDFRVIPAESAFLLRLPAQCVPLAQFPPPALEGSSGALLHSQIRALFDMLTDYAINPFLNLTPAAAESNLKMPAIPTAAPAAAAANPIGSASSSPAASAANVVVSPNVDRRVCRPGREIICYCSPESLVSSSDDIDSFVTACRYNSAIETPADCAICLSAMEPTEESVVVKLNACGHVFHRECLDQAVRHAKKCPTCRQSIGTVQRSHAVGNHDHCMVA